MKIKQAIDVLLNHNQPNKIVTRDRTNFKKLMEILADPYKKMKYVHITGTNGKGSVATKTAQMLQNAGYRTGLYTSPHLFTFRERIQVDGQLAEQEAISDHIIKINEITVQKNIPISYFQILTASAFLYFQEKKCDIVSLEVGLGGLHDSTNIVTPLVSAITSIGLDHMDILGPTVDHIAKDKAGIIKKGAPVVLGPKAQQQVILDFAKSMQSPIHLIDPVKIYENVDEINKDICREIGKILNDKYQMKVDNQSIQKGIQARPMCRMEKLKDEYLPKWAKNKQIYFDVGHNPDAINEVLKYFKGKEGKVTVLYGSSRGKNYAEILSKLEEIAQHIYFLVPDHARAAPFSEITSYVGMTKKLNLFRAIEQGNIKKTLTYVLSDKNTDIILVCGSFFIMPEARGFFQPDLIKLQQENLNECYQLLDNNSKK